MEDIRTNIERVAVDINGLLDSDDSLKRLTFEEVDELLKTKFLLTNPSWEQRQEETRRVKERYVGHFEDNMDKLLMALFHWKDSSSSSWNETIDINLYKRQIMDYVNCACACPCPCATTTLPYKSVETFDLVWKLVMKNKIVFTPEDIRGLDVRFLRHIMARPWYEHPFKTFTTTKQEDYDSSSEYGCGVLKTLMTPQERFWLNVVVGCSKEDVVDMQKLLTCLALDVDQRQRFLPMKATVFGEGEGDLLPQIMAHYEGAQISPVIKWRRNLGILLDNKPHQFHEFSEVIGDGCSVFVNKLTVELPYMCYAYVDRVEVDILDYSWVQGEKECYVDMGDEYILQHFRPYTKQNSHDGTTTISTIHKKCGDENEFPCYYLSVSFGLSKFHAVKAVRVYGKAVSFV